MRSELLQLLVENDHVADLDAAARRLAFREIVARASVPLEPHQAVARLSEFVDGYGPITSYMNDPDVTDVLINGPDDVWVERRGELVRTDATFGDVDGLDGFVERWMAAAGERADYSRPIADGRLPDGSRIHVVMPPIAGRSPVVSIRRFPRQAFALEELVERGMLDRKTAEFLSAAVARRESIVIGGATGTGKTTLLNALLQKVPPGERLLVVEETPELRPRCDHVVALTTRTENVEGRGEVPLAELVRAALRMRPDRIVIGEVRGPEALVALDAMSTGHEGSMMTVHCNSADEAIDRVANLALGAASNRSERSVQSLARRAFDHSVFLERSPNGRRVSSVSEVKA
ncbi:MAG: CpaF family protein [Actinomycetota bacterium]